jgi:sacsin
MIVRLLLALPHPSDVAFIRQWGGHIALIGFASGDIPKLPANVLLVKNITGAGTNQLSVCACCFNRPLLCGIAAHGIYWGSYAAHRPRVLRDSLAQLAAWAADGRLRVRVSHAVPMAAAQDAFAALLRREAIGKVVLTMGPAPRL